MMKNYTIRAYAGVKVILTVDADSKEDAELAVREDNEVSVEDADLQTMQILDIYSIEESDKDA